MNSAAWKGKKLNRYLQYTPGYDDDYSVYVVFPQKDGTLTSGHIDWSYRGERAFAYMFGRLEYNEPDYWDPNNFKKT